MKMRKIATIIFLGIVVWAAGSVTGSQQFGDISVSPLSFPIIDATHGYAEHRMRIVNKSPDADRTVTVRIPGNVYSYSREGINRLSRTVRISPGAETTVSLFQPHLGLNGSGARISIDGREMQEKLRIPSIGSHYNSYRDPKPCLLFSRSVNRDTVMDAIKKIRKKTYSRYRSRGEYECAITRPDAGVESWSDSWLAYTAFDAIFLKAHDMRIMPAETTRALWKYVECGGVLIVIGSAKPPGYCSSQKDAREGITINYAGFGEFITCSVTNEAQLTTSRLNILSSSWEASSLRWHNQTLFNGPNACFPVIEELNIPIRSILLLMVFFIVLIGPVNMFILAKLNRRIWLLWTVPGISFIFCVIVFIHSLFSEGITPTIRIESYTMLDQAEHQAVSLGIIAYYCPLTPGQGLHFPYEYEVSPIIPMRRRRNQGSSKTIDDTRDQHFKSGWIVSRIPAHFYIRSHEPRRERVEFTRNTDGGITAVNGLGADITRLVVADTKNRIYEARKIKAGASIQMKPIAKTGAAATGTLTARFIYTNGSRHENIYNNTKVIQSVLTPETYYAEIESSPFIQEGLSGNAYRNYKSIVLGKRIEIGER